MNTGARLTTLTRLGFAVRGALYIVISFKPLGEEWPACPRVDRHSGGSQHNTAKLHARPAANGMSRWRSNGAGK